MSKKKSLYVCYVRHNSDPASYEKPVYCYAFSFCHAKNLAIRFCVDSCYWDLNSFYCSEPFLVNNFMC